MTNLGLYILLILAGVGVANAITNEYVFEWLRKRLPEWEWIQRLFNCITCMSFWTTLALSFCFGVFAPAFLLAASASLVGSIINVYRNSF